MGPASEGGRSGCSATGRCLTGMPCVRGTHREGTGGGGHLHRGHIHPSVPPSSGEPEDATSGGHPPHLGPNRGQTGGRRGPAEGRPGGAAIAGAGTNARDHSRPVSKEKTTFAGSQAHAQKPCANGALRCRITPSNMPQGKKYNVVVVKSGPVQMLTVAAKHGIQVSWSRPLPPGHHCSVLMYSIMDWISRSDSRSRKFCGMMPGLKPLTTLALGSTTDSQR